MTPSADPQRIAAPHPRAAVDILGVQVDCVDTAATLERMAAWIDAARAVDLAVPSQRLVCRQICTVNPEFVIDACRNPDFAAVLRRADLRVPDGIGILWAARLQGVRLHERVTGSDSIYEICKRAAREGWRVYFLGAAPGVGQRTAEILSRLYPGLRVAGTFAGSPDLAAWPGIARAWPRPGPILSLSPTVTRARTFGSTATAPSCRRRSPWAWAGPSIL